MAFVWTFVNFTKVFLSKIQPTTSYFMDGLSRVRSVLKRLQAQI
jgi:hypothetical protein